MNAPEQIVSYPIEPVSVPQNRAFAGVIEAMPALTQYFRIILRWRWLILGAIGAVILLGLIATLLMNPLYTATTTVEIARESDYIVKVETVQREAAPNDIEFYQTQYGVLKSRAMAEGVATALKLPDDPKFFEMYGTELPEAQAVLAPNGKFVRAGYDDRLRAAGNILLKNLKVAPIASSRLVDIKLTSPSAEFSAKLANAWAEQFISYNLERKMDRTAYARQFLERRLEQLRQKLEESERALVNNAATQEIITFSNVGVGADAKSQTGERSLATVDLEQFNNALSQATAERIGAEAQLRKVDRSTDLSQNANITALRTKRGEVSAEYARMMGQFEPGYPQAKALQLQLAQLDRSIANEEGRIIANSRSTLEGSYRAAVAREDALKSRVTQLKNAVLDQRRKGIQYNIYQRDVDTNRQLYDALLQRYKEIGVAGGIGTNNVSFVDKADTPRFPASPKISRNLLLGLLAGLMLGCVTAFGLDFLDETFKVPEDLEKETGFPVVGVVPLPKGGISLDEAMKDNRSPISEAYRSLRTSLQFSTPQGLPSSLLITSSSPSEGKSTTSIGIATTLGQMGLKVLLIDADLRKSSIHRRLHIPNERGLSNYLIGGIEAADTLQTTPLENVFVITSGPLPPNPAELLSGSRMADLVRAAGDAYDIVVVDGPPIIGLADAPLLAGATQGTLLLVSANSTRKRTLRVAVRRMLVVRTNIIGVVLNKFDRREAGYGYGYGYGDYEYYGYGQKQLPSQNNS